MVEVVELIMSIPHPYRVNRNTRDTRTRVAAGWKIRRGKEERWMVTHRKVSLKESVTYLKNIITKPEQQNMLHPEIPRNKYHPRRKRFIDIGIFRITI